MKKIMSAVFFSAVLIFLSGCKDTVVEPQNAADFFPMKAGNKWYYKTTFGSRPDSGSTVSMIWEITGQKEFQGKHCFVMLCTDLTREDIIVKPDTFYYYKSGQRLYRYFKSSSNETEFGLYADFSLLKGARFQSKLNGWNHEITVESRTDSTISFYYRIPEATDSEFRVVFKKNTGIESSHAFYGSGIQLLKSEIH